MENHKEKKSLSSESKGGWLKKEEDGFDLGQIWAWLVCSLHLSGKDPNYRRKKLHHTLPFPPPLTSPTQPVPHAHLPLIPHLQLPKTVSSGLPLLNHLTSSRFVQQCKKESKCLLLFWHHHQSKLLLAIQSTLKAFRFFSAWLFSLIVRCVMTRRGCLPAVFCRR